MRGAASQEQSPQVRPQLSSLKLESFPSNPGTKNFYAGLIVDQEPDKSTEIPNDQVR